jgi:glycosyltransferase involved in cell wall biosynthesis
MKKISVVMPYSGSPTLKYTLQSLQNQTLSNSLFELVLVGQTDAPIEEGYLGELCEFDLIYLPYRVKKSFRGHSAGRMRNLGVQHARFDTIMFLDSDCVVGPSCLLRHLAHHAGTAKVVVCGGCRSTTPHSCANISLRNSRSSSRRVSRISAAGFQRRAIGRISILGTHLFR